MARKKKPPGGPDLRSGPRVFLSSHEWLGKKILRHAPANPFMRFARRAVNRGTTKKRLKIFSYISPDSEEVGKNPSFFWYFPRLLRSREKFVLFFRLRRSRKKRTLVCRRKSQAIFDGRRWKEKSSIFLFPEKGPEKKDLGFVFFPSGN